MRWVTSSPEGKTQSCGTRAPRRMRMATWVKDVIAEDAWAVPLCCLDTIAHLLLTLRAVRNEHKAIARTGNTQTTGQIRTCHNGTALYCTTIAASILANHPIQVNSVASCRTTFISQQQKYHNNAYRLELRSSGSPLGVLPPSLPPPPPPPP